MKYLRTLLITLLTASSMVLAEPVSNEADDKVKIPQSKYVRSIYSGGDPRDYSEDIKQNHKEYTDFRGMGYQFHDLAQPNSAVIKALNGKQKYWAKIVILQQAMNDSNVPENSWVAWVDDDIVINDVNNSPAMMDRIIQAYGKDKSVIVAKEDSDWAYLNTGIMLIKKDQGGRDVLEKLMDKSQQSRFGKLDQTKSFHEQGALKELYLGVSTNRSHDHYLEEDDVVLGINESEKQVEIISIKSDTSSSDKKVKQKSEIITVPDKEAVIQTWQSEDRKGKKIHISTSEFVCDKDASGEYIERHVSVVPQRDGKLNFNNFRRFSHTDESRLVLNSETGKYEPIVLVYDDSDNAKARDSDAFIHHTGMKQSLRSESIKQTISEIKKTALLVSAPETDEELNTQKKEHRRKVKEEQLKERDEKKRIIAVNPSTEAVLKAEQKEKREKAKAVARKKLNEARKKVESESIDESIAAAEKTRESVETPVEQAVELVDLHAEFNSRILIEASESVEQGILDVQSLNSAASMMILTTMAGFSSVMSGFRTGRLFSYGMTSIDDVVPDNAVASIHPSAQSRTINREVGSWHNFVQLNMLQGNRKATGGLPGGSIKGHGLTTGVFYQLNENLITGMMLSIGKTQHNLNQSNGSGRIESIGIGPFISYTRNDWHIDAALTYSSDTYVMKHSDTAGTQYQSEFSGHTLTGYLGVGYDIHLDSLSPLLTLTPMVEVINSRSSHGDYQEESSQGKEVKVGSSASQVTVTRLGLELGYLMDMESPMELKVRAGIQHQTISGQSTRYELPFGMQRQLNVPGSSDKALFTGLALHKRAGSGHIALSYSGTHSSTSNSHGLQLEYERSF